MVSFREFTTKYVDANLSPAARSKLLATAARKMLADLQTSRKAGPAYTVYVDGREGASEDSVSGTGGGTIAYKFSYQAQAAAFALAFLQARSPAGAYRQAFYVGVAGRFTPAASFNPADIAPDAEIIIGNTEPFSRMVDVQIRGGKTIRYAGTPANMFSDAARATRRAFRSVTAQRVASVDFPGRYKLLHGPHAGEAVGSPALLISRGG